MEDATLKLLPWLPKCCTICLKVQLCIKLGHSVKAKNRTIDNKHLANKVMPQLSWPDNMVICRQKLYYYMHRCIVHNLGFSIGNTLFLQENNLRSMPTSTHFGTFESQKFDTFKNYLCSARKDFFLKFTIIFKVQNLDLKWNSIQKFLYL